MRHGQTPSNVVGSLDTALPGPGLTDLGHRQAQAAVEPLLSRRPQSVHVSGLVRTHETAAPVLAALGLHPTVQPGLEEIAAGRWECRTDEEAVRGYLHAVGAWVRGDLDTRMVDAEDGHEFMARYDSAIRRVADTGDDCALVVSHGAAIRSWVSRRAAASREHVGQILDNTALIALLGDPDSGWRVQEWHARPLGEHLLADFSAPDPTGHPAPD